MAKLLPEIFPIGEDEILEEYEDNKTTDELNEFKMLFQILLNKVFVIASTVDTIGNVITRKDIKDNIYHQVSAALWEVTSKFTLNEINIIEAIRLLNSINKEAFRISFEIQLIKTREDMEKMKNWDIKLNKIFEEVKDDY